MKILLVILTLITFNLSSALAEESLTNTSIDALKKQGYEVRLGELTGAGSKMSLVRLAGLIHPKGIVMKDECAAIIVTPGSNPNNLLVSDIKQVHIDNSSIAASEFVGFFYH